MTLEPFYAESPTWHEKTGDIHAILERVKINEERSGDVGANVGVNDQNLVFLRREPRLSAKELASLLNKMIHWQVVENQQ